MNVDLVVCPGCRTMTPERIDLRTLERTGDLLACECGRRYPIVDGVPIVVADVGAFMRTEAASVVERDLPVEVAMQLAGGGDDAPYTRLLEHVGIYVDAHWGDRSEPGADGTFGIAALAAKIRVLPRVGLAVELGCSAGRIVAELAHTADHVVGLELQFSTLRRARRVLAGERLGFARRTVGWHYTAAFVQAGNLATDHVTLVCGTALDPPLIPQSYDRVVALNLLDSIPHPRRLVAVMDALCAPGGELVIATPYAWQSTTVPDDERFGGADPAAALVKMLVEGTGLGARYAVEDEADLPWSLRRDARTTVSYRTHYVRARKA